MKNVPLTPRDSGLLFRQVCDYILTRIERGEWREHDRLPSIRQLAAQFQVHRLTVFRAYQKLKQDGVVYVKDKAGYFVSPGNAEHVPTELAKSHAIAASAHLKNDLSAIQRLPALYQFSQALIDPNLLPNLYLSEYVKQVFDTYPKLIGSYSPVQGDEELRETLCRYLSDHSRIQLNAGEMLITSGATQAIDLLSRTFIRPMDVILVERPTYSAALDSFRQMGCRIVSVEIHPDGYDLERVELVMKQYKPRFFYMNPTFHNPTGYTVPSSQRKRLVELAEQYHCLLIEDDAFHEMYFEEPPPRPLFSYDTDGWVVYLRSFSKYMAPGLRICAVAGRRSVIEPLVTAKSLADNGTPLVNQKIFLHYFQSERMWKHLDKLRIALQIRKDVMEEELAASGWTWVSPKGGLNLWVQLPEKVDMKALLAENIRQSVSFVPGAICDPLMEMQNSLRLCYSFINEGQLREGMKRLVNIGLRPQFYHP